MTIPSSTRKAGPYSGNASATTFTFTFKVFATTDIGVYVANSLAVETLKVLNTNYTVTLNGNQETSPGGTVTYPISGSPLPVGSVLSIVGALPFDQPLDIPAGGNFNPVALENELDRLVMQIQQLSEALSRGTAIAVTSSATSALPSPIAEYVLGWNAGGTALINYPRTGAAYYETIIAACSDETTALTSGSAKVTFRMPYNLILTSVRASLTTAQTSGSILTVDVNEGGTSILATKLTIDNTERTSTTAATPAVTSDNTLAIDSEITIDIDQVGDGTAKGLKVYLIGTRG